MEGAEALNRDSAPIDRVHHLKTEPTWYEALLLGSKTFEVRRDDRGYQRGDLVVLREWIPPVGTGSFIESARDLTGEYTGRELEYRIGFVFRRGFGCDLGEFVVFSLLPIEVPT